VDWCSGRTKRSASSRGGHPRPSRSSSPSIPPFCRRHGAWEACALFSTLFSSFRSLALRRKGELLWAGVGEGLKAARAPGVATLVLLDSCPTHFPPFCEGVGLGGDCPLFEPPPVRGLDTFVSLSLVRFSSFCPLALHLLWGGGCPPLFSFVADFFGSTWKRLSATDISALVTMKNVAKCDT
jgi:hypothetical protein